MNLPQTTFAWCAVFCYIILTCYQKSASACTDNATALPAVTVHVLCVSVCEWRMCMGTFQHRAGCYSRHSSWQTAGMQLLLVWTMAKQNTSDKAFWSDYTTHMVMSLVEPKMWHFTLLMEAISCRNPALLPGMFILLKWLFYCHSKLTITANSKYSNNCGCVADVQVSTWFMCFSHKMLNLQCHLV